MNRRIKHIIYIIIYTIIIILLYKGITTHTQQELTEYKRQTQAN